MMAVLGFKFHLGLEISLENKWAKGKEMKERSNHYKNLKELDL